MCLMFTPQTCMCECVATNVFILGSTNTRLSPSWLFERPTVSVICEFELYTVPKRLKMSASPIARAATISQSIPSRRVMITDPSQMPDVYSSTPGGTLYSTTPGGNEDNWL